MFGFSRRRMKLGRLKVHLGDSAQGARSPLRPSKRQSHPSGENVGSTPPPNASSDDLSQQACVAATSLSKCASGKGEKWMVISTLGDKPAPRSNHAAAVVGSRMVVVGGESSGELYDDTQVLDLEKLTWTCASPKASLSPSGVPLKIPACKGHSLVAWGKKVLLVGGKTMPVNDRITVWSFDIEKECWSLVEAKGDIPVARGGHTVVRAGSVLILFGGEDGKGKKLNDLHMFDLKSSMWLPLHYTGTGPSPRCNHVASLYDDKILFIFGGQSKSRILNDIYSLDFETMVWSRSKVRGYHPSPRAGSCGVLCGTKWYITGGGTKKRRFADTLVYDVLKHEISVAVASNPTSITTNKGFSMISLQHKEKVFLVAFGGGKKEVSNQVELLIIKKDNNSIGGRSTIGNPLVSENDSNELDHLKSNTAPCSTNSVVRHSLASAMEHHQSTRRSLSESKLDPNSSGGVSLRKQFHNDEDHKCAIMLQKALDDEKFRESDDGSQIAENRNKVQETVVKMDTASSITNMAEDALFLDQESHSAYQDMHQGSAAFLPDSDDMASPGPDGKPISCVPSNISQLYEAKVAALVRKNVHLEGHLATALVNQENTEKKLSSVLKNKQEVERRLSDAVKEIETLEEKLASAELAQEEANSISNLLHSDNVKLEHDVAFLKAVLEDTQKELHSTRGVLAGERARAFQLQVEVFHLKQRLQSMENRAPTPRKAFQT